MYDPLSAAHLGYITSESENCNPCTVANLGFIVFGLEDSDYKPAGGKHVEERYSNERINQLLEWRAKNKEFTTLKTEDDRSLEIERAPVVKVKSLPIPMDAPSLGDINDSITRDIARELRYQAIQEHARLVREEIEETRKLDEEILLVIIASGA